jgi:hypothetical protein
MPNEGEVIEVTATEVSEAVEGKTAETEVKEASPETKEDEQDPEAAKKTTAEAETKAKTEEERERNKKFAKERIEKKNKERALELENVKLKARLEAIEEFGLKKPESKTAPKAEDFSAEFSRSNPKPKIEDFETVSDHAEAVADWTYKKNEAIKEKLVEAKETEAKSTAAKTEQTKAQEAFDAQLDVQKAKGEEKYEDFEEIVGAVMFSATTMAAIAASESGEDLAYYLAMNPQENERIKKLEPILQVKEAAKIEIGLEKGTIQIKKTTSAPPPPATVHGNANPNVDWSKKSDSDWYKNRRQKQINSA